MSRTLHECVCYWFIGLRGRDALAFESCDVGEKAWPVVSKHTNSGRRTGTPGGKKADGICINDGCQAFPRNNNTDRGWWAIAGPQTKRQIVLVSRQNQQAQLSLPVGFIWFHFDWSAAQSACRTRWRWHESKEGSKDKWSGAEDMVAQGNYGLQCTFNFICCIFH